MITSFKVVLGFLFILLISAIVFLGVLSYSYYQVFVSTADLVYHTYSVIGKTEKISSSYKDLQLESNALLVSGDSSFAETYRIARRRVAFQLDELKSFTADNQSQQDRVDSLTKMIKRLISFTDTVLIMRFNKSAAVAELPRRLIANAILRAQTGQIITDIIGREFELLALRQRSCNEINVAFRNRFMQLIGGILILLGTTFISIRYNFNERIKAENALKNAENELKLALSSEIELNKMKSNFVTLASHEFRTPLTTILSSTFLLEKYATGGDKVKIDKHLARIRSSIASITSILDDFLSINKIEEQKVVPHIDRVNLKERLERTCQDLRALVKPGQSIVYTHTGEDFVETDPVLLGNIVTNLISNAIKYSPENSPIIVKSSVDGRLHLLVKDNGMGIPIEDQKHLFKRFYRASNAGAIQGTGLGLNIMKHYVDMLHGEIKLQSEQGSGTEVEITFKTVNGMSENGPHFFR
jgi:signal transduction histidine kinase